MLRIALVTNQPCSICKTTKWQGEEEIIPPYGSKFDGEKIFMCGSCFERFIDPAIVKAKDSGPYETVDISNRRLQLKIRESSQLLAELNAIAGFLMTQRIIKVESHSLIAGKLDELETCIEDIVDA